MEKELFEWKEWDQPDTFSFLFSNCKLLKDIGPLKAGEMVKEILLDYDKGVLQAYDGEKVLCTFKIHLTIGEEIMEEAN